MIDLGERQLKNIAKSIRVSWLEISVAASAKPTQPKKRPALTLPAMRIAALLIVTAASAWCFLDANRRAAAATNAPAPAEAARLSIVALPFANLSGDPAQDYIADILTDELTTALARIPNSFVIARNTAFTYKGKPVEAKAIGKDLGVRYILQGSAQSAAPK